MRVKMENQVFHEVRLNPKSNHKTAVYSTLYSTDVPYETSTADFVDYVEQFCNDNGIKCIDIDFTRNGMTRLWQFRVVTVEELIIFSQ